MYNIPLQENHNVSNHPNQTNYPKSITIATQTDNPTSIGNGTTPLDPNRVENPFDTAQSDTSIPLANLHKVLNENFISEAIRLHNQSNRIRTAIQNQDWLALKHYSRFWHTLKKRFISKWQRLYTLWWKTLHIPKFMWHCLTINS